ncbi:hypothetical protein F4861DRAFT_163558 [Xylaria intraflava]|nr:hypothetical protein F4861DRAFT_163558 [Xylaria intraflava]
MAGQYRRPTNRISTVYLLVHLTWASKACAVIMMADIVPCDRRPAIIQILFPFQEPNVPRGHIQGGAVRMGSLWSPRWIGGPEHSDLGDEQLEQIAPLPNGLTVPTYKAVIFSFLFSVGIASSPGFKPKKENVYQGIACWRACLSSRCTYRARWMVTSPTGMCSIALTKGIDNHDRR